MHPNTNRSTPPPQLLPIGMLVRDQMRWNYAISSVGGGLGTAALRVWMSPPGGHVAVVTELGTGLSITNGAEHIHAALNDEYPGLILFEHYPATPPLDHLDEHIDQVVMTKGKVSWRAVWPVPPANPNFMANQRWIRLYGTTISPGFAV